MVQMQYEITPFRKVLERALEHFKPGSRLTFTCSPRLGILKTIDAAVKFSECGYVIVPHIAVRTISSKGLAEDILHRLQHSSVRNIFVVGGDGQQTGPYASAEQFLCDNRESLQGFNIGIAAYPTGFHRHIITADLHQAFYAKLPYASFIVTQLADKNSVQVWLSGLREKGCKLPVYVGIPQNASARKILRCLATQASLHEAVLYAVKNPSVIRDGILKRKFTQHSLEELFAAQGKNGYGPLHRHIYTFNAF